MYLAGLAHAQAEAQELTEGTSNSPDRGDKPVKAFSCLRCFERKVKCDKSHPCANCVKSNVECNFRIPSAPRRKKKKRGTEEILLDRLNRAEELLRSRGLLADAPQEPLPQNDALVGTDGTSQRLGTGTHVSDLGVQLRPARPANNEKVDEVLAKQGAPFAEPRLLVDQGSSKTRFIDNQLWSSLSGEFRNALDAIQDESSDEEDHEATVETDDTDFLLGLSPASHLISHLHPSQEGIFKMWAVFLENVNPMTKVIHYPSLQEKLVQASENIESIDRGLEALMFSIYVCAVTSLNDSECERAFKENRKTLLTRYRQGVKRALSRAHFMGTGDVTVLQAFTLYLLMMRDEYDARTLWTLAGVANRIAQGMGVHRDGTVLGLPPFETEMRRRLWWQIAILDFRSAELSGSGRFGDFSVSDTKVPTNVDDSDIWPGMTEAPVNKEGTTELLTCLMRCEFGAFWKEKLMQKGLRGEVHPKDFFSVNFQPPHHRADGAEPWLNNMKGRDRDIDELDERLRDKFVKYCDPSVPHEMMALQIAKGAIASMRLMAHHPRRWSNEKDIPQSERKLLWELANKLIAGDNICHSTRALKIFKWHLRVYFQWQALIYLLGELHKHTSGEEVDAAWKQIDECYENHPEFIEDYRRPLHVAVGNLCLKAYEAREKALREDYLEKRSQGAFVLERDTPAYIETLRRQRSTPRRKESKQTPLSGMPGLSHTTSSNSTASWPTQQRTPSTNDRMSNFKMQEQFRDVVPPGSGLASMGFNAPAQLPISTPSTASIASTTTQHLSNTVSMGTGQQNEFAYDPVMMNYDPNMMMDTNMGGLTGSGDPHQMDWNQWDFLIQEFEMPSTVHGTGVTGAGGMGMRM